MVSKIGVLAGGVILGMMVLVSCEPLYQNLKETKDECLIGFVDKIVATNDYYYVGIINHKESDTYMEAAGYKQNAVVNDMDDMAVFIPLTTYKNAVYSCISPGRFVESKAFGKQVELDDNPIIVKFELK